MTLQTTRRSFVAAIPVAAVAVAAPASAITAPADRRAWEFALVTYQRAKAEDDAFSPIYDRILLEWKAGRPSMDAIHWKEFSYLDRYHTARVMDLDKAWSDFLAGEGKLWGASDPEARKDRYRAALDSVQAFRDAEAKHNHDSGMDAADDRWDVLGDRTHDTHTELMAAPAPDLAALRWKLDHILEVENKEDGGSTSCWSGSYVAQTLTDIARLLPPAA